MKTKQLFNVLLICCFIIPFSIPEANAQTTLDIPIVKLKKVNKGLFGYSRSEWVLNDDYGGLGWEGKCIDPGLSRCKPPNSLPDPVDEAYSTELSDFATVQIANGSRGGSEQQQVQVLGEPFMRVYNVTWTSTPVTTRPTPTVGDGQTIEINVERTDI